MSVSLVRAWFAAMLALMLLVTSRPAVGSASAQGNEALLKSGVIMVLQGENDVIPGVESDNDFYALKILTYDLPSDVSRVHTKVPSQAKDFVVWTSSGEINGTGFGIEPSGSHDGDFYVNVPSSHPRSSHSVKTVDDENEFNTSGSEFLNTTFSSSALRLATGADHGEYVSSAVQFSGAHHVSSANLTYVSNSSSNITSFISNDGGVTWTSSQDGATVNFSTAGTSLRARFVFAGNSSAGFDPFVSSYSLNATFVLNSTMFTVHISYVWTVEAVEGKTALDFSEAADLAPDGEYLLMLYLVRGFTVDSSGIVLTFDEEGVMSTNPEKDLYYNVTSASDQPASFVVEIAWPAEKGMTLYYVGAAALVVALGLAYVISRRSRSVRDAMKTKETETEEPTTSPVDGSTRRKELVARKKEMLAEIEAIMAKMSSGELSKTDGVAEADRMRKELRTIRNELNRLPKEPSPAQYVPTIRPSEESAPGSDPHLAALARIDEDFEKGRLSEGSYRSLRKEYVSKAAKALEAERKAEPPLDGEKKKLMEAITALDDERERGEIDEKVYAELRSSYKKQLIELTKRSGRGLP